MNGGDQSGFWDLGLKGADQPFANLQLRADGAVLGAHGFHGGRWRTLDDGCLEVVDRANRVAVRFSRRADGAWAGKYRHHRRWLKEWHWIRKRSDRITPLDRGPGGKTVVCVPCGRQRYLQILFTYLDRLDRTVVDEVHLWCNTVNQPDIDVILAKAKTDPFFKVVHLPADQQVNANKSVWNFIIQDCHPDNLYVKIDDDIVFVEERAIERLIERRKLDPRPFLLFPNTINNTLCSHIHQRLGVYDLTRICGWDAACPNGWKSAEQAETIHRTFLTGYDGAVPASYKFAKWVIWDYVRVSINCICYFGKDILSLPESTVTYLDDELLLTSNYPEFLKRPSEIIGDIVIVHFGYFTQRPTIDKPELLAAYQAIAMASRTGAG